MSQVVVGKALAGSPHGARFTVGTVGLLSRRLFGHHDVPGRRCAVAAALLHLHLPASTAQRAARLFLDVVAASPYSSRLVEAVPGRRHRPPWDDVVKGPV